MASSGELVRFVGEVCPDDDSSGSTSKKTGFHASGLLTGRKRNRRQAAVVLCRSIDEENGVGGNEGEVSSPGEEEKGVGEGVEAPRSSTVWGYTNVKTAAN
ncbi:UNVERIFIED_CONTAM: hypothetical protein Sangu_1562400 [Sesamum angustifolium]|uniref:Uncharacterized protein n=1 Tax=Sesamum angustifolium TaxID=2727405 RepID=A0AAW2MUC5_9LAMI